MYQKSHRLKFLILISKSIIPVSYTHLDVYKRQIDNSARTIPNTALERIMKNKIRKKMSKQRTGNRYKQSVDTCV